MSLKKCTSKNPYFCRFHGIKKAMDGTITCEAVRALQEDTMNALVRKVLDRVENANHFGYIAPNLEKLISLYKRDTFLPPSAYFNLEEKRWVDDKIPDANFEAEAQRQISELKQAGILTESESALRTMTTNGEWNHFVRFPSSVPTSASDKLLLLTTSLDAAYSVTTERAYSNRLFRGVSFSSKQDLTKWIDASTTPSPSSKLLLRPREYFRTSTSLHRAYSFSSKNQYPVIFEVLSNKGLYLNSQLSNAPQEKEVLLNKLTTFKVVSFREQIPVNEATGKRTIAVLQLIEV